MDSSFTWGLKTLSYQLVLFKNQLSLTIIDFSQTEHTQVKFKKKIPKIGSLGLFHFLLSVEELGLEINYD